MIWLNNSLFTLGGKYNFEKENYKEHSCIFVCGVIFIQFICKWIVNADE